MAFACRPKLIILDEPTTGLDVTTQRHVLDSIRGLCSIYHVGAVYVSHDLAVVADIANTIGVMYAGRLVELGPAARAFRAPGHPYTRGLLRAIPSTRPARTCSRGWRGSRHDPARGQTAASSPPAANSWSPIARPSSPPDTSSTARRTGRGACAQKR